MIDPKQQRADRYVHQTVVSSAGDTLHYLVRYPHAIDCDYLQIFLHGQLNRAKYRPPMFQRQDSSTWLDAVCVFVSDPVLLRSAKCTIGWHLLGDEEFWFHLDAATSRICFEYSLKGIVWHGPSSGGYAAVRNAVRSCCPSMALAIAPQNSPIIMPFWREFAPYSEISGTAKPIALSELLSAEPLPAEKLVYIATSDQDLYHLREHIYPIGEVTWDNPGVYLSLLRNGSGHGPISEADYWSSYKHGLSLWESRRGAQDATGRTGGWRT